MKKAIALAALLALSISAHSAVNTLAPNGTKVAASGLSQTVLAQISATTGSVNVSVYYCTQTAMATVTVDNSVNTGTVFVLFAALSSATGVDSTHLGKSMEAVLTGQTKTWKVCDGTWPIGYPWMHIINAAGFSPTKKGTW